MKKVKFLKFIILMLIIVGVVTIFVGIYYKQSTKNVQDVLKERLNNLINDKNLYKIEYHNKNKKENMSNEIYNITPIALLQIPKIDLEAVVAEGVEDNIIKYAIGHFENTVEPGEKGNCALIGHRNFDTGEFFLNIHKLEKNNDIIVINSKGKFTYKVQNQYEVEAKDISVLNNTEDSILTLITCSWNGKKRLIVRGILVSAEYK